MSLLAVKPSFLEEWFLSGLSSFFWRMQKELCDLPLLREQVLGEGENGRQARARLVSGVAVGAQLFMERHAVNA